MRRKIYKWENESDREQVINIIGSRKKNFYLILKTKDEIEYLPYWIQHHLKYFDPEQILIFDNMSELEETYRIYDNLPEQILLIQFEGFHDEIHIPRRKFNLLYQTLIESAKFFWFIDTDEFIITKQENSNIFRDFDSYFNRLIKEDLKRQPDFLAIPYIYFPSFRNINLKDLWNQLLWGKPILISNSNLFKEGFLIHNIRWKLSGLIPFTCHDIFLLTGNFDLKRDLRIYTNKLIKHLSVVKSEFDLDLSFSNLKNLIKQEKLDEVVLELAEKELIEVNNYVNHINRPNLSRFYNSLKTVLNRLKNKNVQTIDLYYAIEEATLQIEKVGSIYKNLIDVLNLDSTPLMPYSETFYFLPNISHKRAYLEYGVGGSTLTACLYGVDYIYSVDTDERWIDLVKAKIKKLEQYRSIEGIYIDHINVGQTKEWGYPQDFTKFFNFPLYCITPWLRAYQTGVLPDLVFIDGRFRVASFLVSAMLCKPGTKILFDDYFDRPWYHIVEKYVKPKRRVGRLAEFEIVEPLKLSAELLYDLLKYSVDPDNIHSQSRYDINTNQVLSTSLRITKTLTASKQKFFYCFFNNLDNIKEIKPLTTNVSMFIQQNGKDWNVLCIAPKEQDKIVLEVFYNDGRKEEVSLTV